MQNSTIPITFVIPVRNDAIRLRACLESIARATARVSGTEVIVVDNASTDNSAAVAREAGAVVLQHPHLRVAQLRNRGAAAARGGILAFVDADHELPDAWATDVQRYFESPDVGAAGGPCFPPSPPSWVQRIYNAFRDHRPGTRDVSWLGSGTLAVTREAFRRTVGFDESLEACEDVDFCQRLRKAGYRLLQDPRLGSLHKGEPATLTALFLGELWRGRDNVRVSLRVTPAVKELPSIVIPIVDLLCLAAIVIGILGGTSTMLAISMPTLALLLAFAGSRAARVFLRLPDRTWFDVPRALAVALVYDIARALALIVRVPHRRSRSIGAVQPQKS